MCSGRLAELAFEPKLASEPFGFSGAVSPLGGAVFGEDIFELLRVAPTRLSEDFLH